MLNMMEFKSPSLERTMTRLSQSVVGGIVFSGALLIVIFMTDYRDSELPLVVRHPFAWMFFWPDLLWKHILHDDQVDIATIITNGVIYIFVSYGFLKWREKQRRLP